LAASGKPIKIPPMSLLLPDAPTLVAHPGMAIFLSADGELETLSLDQAARRARHTPPLFCHRIAVAARLRTPPETLFGFDLLELFAFVRPARFCVPTPRGLAETLGLGVPADAEGEAIALQRCAHALLAELSERARFLGGARRIDLQGIAWDMAQAGWSWGRSVLAALGAADYAPKGAGALHVWERLGEWIEHSADQPPGDAPVSSAEARTRLAELLGDGAEQRPSQADYASAAAMAFLPRRQVDAPNLVLAEAGTGTGKTLGYIAPASLWAERNGAPVWISTYTRNLQRQLDGELSRLYPDAAVKSAKVVIRKGRENYFCLLNFEEALRRGHGGPERVALGLLAVWALATRDGDMVGGDLPGWLVELLGRGRTLGLADRRGECIYAGCAHFRKCFIEKTARRAKGADIVVANHALVMVQAAFGGLDEAGTPLRYVFDEGHHLFDAADNAFAAALSGAEGAELRRWLLGAEAEGGASRARGLKRRCEELVASAAPAHEQLALVLQAARALPAPGWHQRLADGRPQGPAEEFLHLLRQDVLARSHDHKSPYSLQCEPRPLAPGLDEAAARLLDAVNHLIQPLKKLASALTALLDDEAAELDSATRGRIEAIARSIDRRGLAPLTAWRAMLASLPEGTPPEFIDWFEVERIDGRDVDVGYHRHWVDPMIPFAETVLKPAHGLVITSATLRDGSGDEEADWQVAERRSGADHLASAAVRAALPSPFDYARQTRALVVGDVRKDDLDQVASAYRELFLAAGGGGLGLFTAVSRLKEVWKRIAPPLDEAGIALLAQHVDGIDIGTLVDIFRAEENSCLLGTDAVRDGVDVPGRSLRLIVFDRVPWPRPDIVHKVRRQAFGKKSYDDMITRLRLKQAYGRLVRSKDDVGVFVLLDPMMPSRLAGAFPPGVEIERVGLKDAIELTRGFLSPVVIPE
jgi:ATP-dependent DNA helicase DinG